MIVFNFFILSITQYFSVSNLLECFRISFGDKVRLGLDCDSFNIINRMKTRRDTLFVIHQVPLKILQPNLISCCRTIINIYD